MQDDITSAGAAPRRHSSTSPSIAVAFGGGGARGIAHIHVIEALDELGIRPVMIAGSSIGAIIGSGMAAGMRGREIADYTLATIGQPKTVANKLWSLRPVTVRSAMTGGLRLGQFNLERILKAFLPPAIPNDFSQLQIPFKVSATDYYGQAELVIETGELYPALAASAAIPALFMPVRIGERIMIDGGIFNAVPYEHLLGHADIVIGVDVVGAPEGDGSHMPNRIDSLFGAGQLMMQANIAMKLRLQPAHIFLRPAVNRFRVLDFLKARDILTESVGIKDDLKRALDREFEVFARA
ncbi:Patatin [Metarhizobium album]|uniref:Patatin n=1 Tax=Metarhizobium album TaxID=2182425 RepID=A0A2U2DXC7_9HYPH|nr:patatin-like phospholipase family protein [Rhizobium album]PWE57968.1 Patatin [Rhizobium album]